MMAAVVPVRHAFSEAAPCPAANLDAMLTRGDPLNLGHLARLDEVAGYLRGLQDNGVDVYLQYGHAYDARFHDALLALGGGTPIANTDSGLMNRCIDSGCRGPATMQTITMAGRGTVSPSPSRMQRLSDRKGACDDSRR